MAKRNDYLLRRAEIIRRIVEENYEPGNQNKCKLQAYRRNVLPEYPMSERSFWRYMNPKKDKEKQDDPRQLKLDF